MPHSSGGGSHGGGSHGGSHHSSRGGSRGSSGPRYSRRPYRNSRRYMYYDRRGRERYIYCSERPKPMSPVSFVITLVFFIPFLISGMVLTATSLTGIFPFRLKPVYTRPASHIEDNTGCINNESELEEVLVKFENKTGISPYILTVTNSDWIENYTNLESYSYTAYLERFSDEQHFLVVYSDPLRDRNSDFIDWYWEGMQGDDTDAIISESHFAKFQTKLHSGLVRENVSVGEAFEDAFSDSLDYMMKPSFPSAEKAETLFFAFIWDLFIVIYIAGILNSWFNSRRQYYEDSTNPVSDSLNGRLGSSDNYGSQYSGYNTRSYGGGYGYQGRGYGTGYGEMKFDSDPDAVRNGYPSSGEAQNINRSYGSQYDVSHIGFDQPAPRRKPGNEMDEISFDDIYGQRTYNSSSDSYQGPEIK